MAEIFCDVFIFILRSPDGTTWQQYPGADDMFAGNCCSPGEQVMMSNDVYGCCAPGETYEWDGTTATCSDKSDKATAADGPGDGGPGTGGPGIGGAGIGGPGTGGVGTGGAGIGGAGIGGAGIDPKKPDPEKTDPEKPDPKKTDPEKTDPKKTDPEKTDPEKTDPKKPDKCTVKSACSEKKACPCTGLGITYGKCYTLTDTKGAVLGRNVLGAYVPGGEYGGVFKVCESETKCSDGDKGTEVPSDGSWTLQDVIGLQGVVDTGYISATTPYMAYSTVFHTPAAVFSGEASCSNGQCGICMRLPSPNGLGLLVWPTDGRYYIAVTTNPMNCLTFTFQETPCLKGPNSSAPADKTEL
ncbi:hypothetical protein MMC11_003726 [Xylographa trunciseda]|nr:hypothetical protein [Xylographa trunciseda]